MTTSPFPVVSAILIRDGLNGKEIFLQKRWKPKKSQEYLGVLEIPAGAVEAFENVYDAIAREVKEETNLTITKFISGVGDKVIYHPNGDECFVFQPFICQQMLKTKFGLPWVGFVFLCEVTGDIHMQSEEARDPKWININELKNELDSIPEAFFSLQLPVLKYLINYLRV